MQSVSIIITCGKQQMQLRRLLPQVLSLHYDGEYEVVVALILMLVIRMVALAAAAVVLLQDW